MNKLTQLREEIDLIDEEIIKLLDQRFQKSIQVKEYKEKNNMPVLDEQRETFIKEKIMSYRGSQIIIEQILEVYSTIFKSSKLLQK